MTELKEGQRVRVEIVHEGTVLAADKSYLRMKKDGAGEAMEHWLDLTMPMEHWLDLTMPGVTVTVLDPPDWPPQVGDIWKADGTEWFARSPRIKTMYLVPDNQSVSHTADELKALNPVLVRRRNADPAKPVGVERSEGQ